MKLKVSLQCWLCIIVLTSVMAQSVQGALEVLWKQDFGSRKLGKSKAGEIVVDKAAPGGKSLCLTYSKPGRLRPIASAKNLLLAGRGVILIQIRGKDLNDVANGLRFTATFRNEKTGRRYIGDGVAYGVRTDEKTYRTLPIYFDVGDKPTEYNLAIQPTWQKQNGDRKPTVWVGGIELKAHGNKTPYISGILRSKLIYAPGMDIKMAVTLVNPTKTAFEGKLLAVECFGIDNRINADDIEVSLPSGEVKTFDLTWEAEEPEAGRNIKFVLQDKTGKEIDRDNIDIGITKDGRLLAYPAHDFEQSWRPNYGGLFYVSPASNSQSKAIIDHWLRKRNNRGGRMEFFSWSWCDLAGFIPPEDPYLGNQGQWWLSLKEYKEQVGMVKSLGIHVVSYILGHALGEAGYELYQKHPDWFMYDRNGEHIGSYNMKTHAKYNKRHDFDFEKSKGHCLWGLLDPTRPEVRRWIADQFISLGKDMGFKGGRWDVWMMEVKPGFYRLDGTEIAPTWKEADKLTAESLRAVKEMVADELPDFTWGYNYAAPEENNHIPLTFAEKCRGHGWMLDEVAISYGRKTSPNHYWKIYSKRMIEWGDKVRKMGGIYDPWIFDRGFSKTNSNHIEVDWLHATIFRILAGGRVWIPNYKNNSSLAGDMPRMGFRFNDIFSGWNLRLQPETQKIVSVDAPSTLWWKGSVFTNKTPDDKEQVIVHLINAPVVEEIGENRDSKVRPAARNVKVKCNAVDGKLPKKAWLIMAESMTPEVEPKVQAVPLKMTKEAEAVTVTVPAVLYLKTVVFEY